MSYTVIIPSRNFTNLSRCVWAVRNHQPDSCITVIDDGVSWASPLSLYVIQGEKPFIFARNCNLGIKAVQGDVILLNDDALLQTPGGFEVLSQISRARPEFGLISAVTNVSGNPHQQPRRIVRDLREESRTVAFVCVYIPRSTIERIGLLDERFTAYGWEDNDYCRRVRNAGLKIGIFDGCFVDHSLLHSTFRGKPRTPGDIGAGREIYREKWGDLN